MPESPLIIWDFDGTLAYRVGGMWSAAVLEIVAKEAPDLTPTKVDVQPFLQTGFPWHTPDWSHTELGSAEEWWDALDRVFERAFKGLGLDSAQASRLAKKVRHVYPDPVCWRLFSDTLPVLTDLIQKGWLHVILSNHVPELPRLAAHLGLDAHIAQIFGSAQTGYEKPHPRAFQMVLEAYPRAPSVTMIGDSLAVDISGAASLGIPGILVRSDRAGCKAHDLLQVPAILADFATGRPEAPLRL